MDDHVAKTLHAAIDFGDDIIRSNRFYDRQHLDSLMGYLASLGVRRVEWIHHCWLAFDETYPLGFDLEAEAIRAAHRNGLEVVAVIKPFEVIHDILPHPFALPPGAAWSSLRGQFYEVPSLALSRRDLCLARRPGAWDQPGPVTAVRLVKNNARPSDLQADDFSLFTSRVNGTWTRYDQPFRVERSVAWRPLFPKPGPCSILTLADLNIPETERYIEVRSRRPDAAGEFVNDEESIIELVGTEQRTLPCTPPGILSLHGRWIEFARNPTIRRMYRSLISPEVEATLGRTAELESWAENMRSYAHKGYPYVPYDFNHHRRVAVARGLDDALPIPHPIYPEVRAYWLGKVRRFLDLGAAGIDFRHCMHFRQFDLHEYGFNAPVLARTDGSVNTAEVARVNGDAYTQLLREAAALTHARQKRFGVHVSSEFLQRADENRYRPFVRNFDFPWENWLHEFCDFAVFRGAMGNRPETVRGMIDRIGLVCREAGKPLVYQGNRRAFTFDGPHPYHDDEMSWVLSHRDVAAYQLYETASITRLNADGAFEGSAAVRALVAKHGFGA